MLPEPPKEWLERVDERHAPYENEYATRRGETLTTYREKAASALAALLEDRELRIRLHNDQLRAFLVEQRWKTIFDRVRSQGLNMLDVRIEVEASVLGVARDCPPQDRPAYGYVQGSDDAHHSVCQWGAVVLHLRPECRDRATVTIGDSLNATNGGDEANLAASPLLVPRLRCRDARCDVLDAKSIGDAVVGTERYAEAQIHGRIEIEDVAYVTYTAGVLPTAEILQLLNDLGLRVVLRRGLL